MKIYLLAIALVLHAAALPAGAQVVYVDLNAPGPEHDGASWDSALLTVQEGVDAATPSGEVWAADGVYVENVVMGEGVQLYGGFLGAEEGGYEDSLDQRDWAANPAVVDGLRLGSCVVMAADSRVDGFVLFNGVGVQVGDDTYGGGIYCGDVAGTIVIANNTVSGNTAVYGGGICCYGSSPDVTDNSIFGNSAYGDGGGIYCEQSDAAVTCNIIVGNSSDYHGGGLHTTQPCSPTAAGNMIIGNAARAGGGISTCVDSSPMLTNNTVVANSASAGGGGIYISFSSPSVTGNIVCSNSAYGTGGGIWSWFSSPTLSYNDVWNNYADDYYGCGPGEGGISADPEFVDPDAGDFHLKADSPCIDAGDNDAMGLPEIDWDADDRIVDDVVDIGADEFVTWTTTAPDPQPECDGALFGEPQSGFPGWVWFSIPMTPAESPVPNDVLGFEANGKLYRYDKYAKAPIVYQPPFSVFDLAVGNSYILWLENAVTNPSYEGLSPFTPSEFEFKLGKMGWTWIGMPGRFELAGDDFMSSVRVKYPSDDTGDYRTAAEDYGATPDNWIAWGWPYWNTWLQAVETFTPYAPFGHQTCYPWVGYRVWVKVGNATDVDDPDQVTLIWPRTGG